MGRVLAIDFGTKRCGLAVTDPDRIIASPLEMVFTSECLNYIQTYCKSNTVDVIVFGLPLSLSGEETHATQPAKAFAEKVKTALPAIEIDWVDERFTSKDAVKALIQAGIKKKDRRKQTGNIDKVSAALILQEYLEQL